MPPADGGAMSAKTTQPAFKPLPMKGPEVDVERRADGAILIQSKHKPGVGPRSIAHLLKEKAEAHPERPFILQREANHGPWRAVTYGAALRAAEGDRRLAAGQRHGTGTTACSSSHPILLSTP